jgi:hypothetical protein
MKVMSKAKELVITRQVQLGLPTTSTGVMVSPGLARYASEGSDYVGDLLKVSGKTGEITYGSQNAELAEGTKLAALLGQAKVGYIEWVDGRPEAQAWLPLTEDPELDLRALRQSLGKLDPSEWEETNPNGSPKDPIRESVMLPMVQMDNGHLFTFSSSSDSGTKATRRLVKNCLIHLRAVPASQANHVPVITIDVGHYQHPIRQVGTIYFPIFDLQDWVPPEHVMHALGKAGNAMAFGAPNREALNADLDSGE